MHVRANHYSDSKSASASPSPSPLSGRIFPVPAKASPPVSRPSLSRAESGVVHSRPQGGALTAKLDALKISTVPTEHIEPELPTGYHQDVRRSVDFDRKDGKSDKRDEGKSSRVVHVGPQGLSIQDFALATKMMATFSMGYGRLGNRLKAYRFASEDKSVPPWSLYTEYNKWAPMGLSGTNIGGAGWSLVAGTLTNNCTKISNDISVSLDFIPQINPATAGGQMARIGNTIYIKKVIGGFKVRRVQLYPGDTGLGTNRYIALNPTYPTVVSFLERCPIQFDGNTDSTVIGYQQGANSVCGLSLYPAPYTASTVQLDSLTSMNFLSYCNAATLCYPYLDNGAGAAGNTRWVTGGTNGGDLTDYDIASNIHRSPAARTEIFSLYHKRHMKESTSETSLTSESVVSALTTTAPVRTMAAHWSYPPPGYWEVNHTHTFPGEGLKVCYADQLVQQYSVAAINQLRARYWQDHPGTMWTTTSATAIPATMVTNGFIDHISYEFFVEFEDGHDD